jgi:hypothetical protein
MTTTANKVVKRELGISEKNILVALEELSGSADVQTQVALIERETKETGVVVLTTLANFSAPYVGTAGGFARNAKYAVLNTAKNSFEITKLGSQEAQKFRSDPEFRKEVEKRAFMLDLELLLEKRDRILAGERDALSEIVSKTADRIREEDKKRLLNIIQKR